MINMMIIHFDNINLTIMIAPNRAGNAFDAFISQTTQAPLRHLANNHPSSRHQYLSLI